MQIDQVSPTRCSKIHSRFSFIETWAMAYRRFDHGGVDTNMILERCVRF